MISFLVNSSVIVVAFLLQNTAGIYFKIGAVVPDFTLVCLVCISLIEGQIPGTVTGFFAGLIKDLVALRGFGVNALTHTIIGYIGGAIESNLISNSIVLMFLVAAATIVSQILYFAVAFIFNYQIDYLFWRYTFLSAAYNALISPFIYMAVNLFYERFTTKKQLAGLKNGQKKI